MILSNNTASSAGTPVQMSPRMRITGSVWDTGAVASRTVNFKHELVPISGNPGTSKLIWAHDYNGGGYVERMSISSLGQLILTGASTFSSATPSGYGLNVIQGTGTVGIGSDANGNYIQSFGSRPLVLNPAGNNTHIYAKLSIGTAATTAPGYSLVLQNTSTGLSLYNTADQATNYENFRTNG